MNYVSAKNLAPSSLLQRICVADITNLNHWYLSLNKKILCQWQQLFRMCIKSQHLSDLHMLTYVSMPQTLRNLRSHVNFVISRLLKIEPDRSKLIYDEISVMSAELDSIIMCHRVGELELLPDPIDDLNMHSHGHRVAQPAILPTVIDNYTETFESCTPLIKDSLQLPHNQESPRSIYETPLHPIDDELSRQPFPAENMNSNHLFHDCEHRQPPSDTICVQNSFKGDTLHEPRQNIFAVDQLLSNQESHRLILAPTALQTSSHNQERPHGSHDTQSSQSSPQVDKSGVSIPYETQDGVLRLLPTMEQWSDFPALLQYAQDLGVKKVGICKVLLPEDIASLSKRVHYTKQKEYCFWAQPQSNGTFIIERSEKNDVFEADSEPVNISSKTATVQRFEQLLHEKPGLENVRYCFDIDVRTTTARESLGLPNSPIWPLKGNRLSETKMRIPGIHWLYAYQADDVFEAPFVMHCENEGLLSINYLHEEDKYWVAMPPKHANLLEEKFKGTNSPYHRSDCAQFLRHSATYFPTSTLDKWKIFFKVVHQTRRETIITFCRVYHQGFSAEYTLAEAVNYADQEWDIQGYRECDPRTCSDGFIRKKMMEFRDQHQEQYSENSDDDNRNEGSSTEEERDQVRNDEVKDKFATKKEKAHRIKLRQNQAAVVSERQTILSKGTKRKLDAQESEKTQNKIPKIQCFFKSSVSAFFNQLSPIPKNLMQPADIYQIFADRSQNENENGIWLLTRLFFAIVSPDAFYQLRDACIATQRNEDLSILQPINSISQTIQALDHLNTTVFIISILRRYYLTFLMAHRNERERHHQSQRPRRVPRTLEYGYMSRGQVRQTSTNQEVFERASSLTLTDLMTEAYSDMKQTRKHRASGNEYQKKLQFLKDRLRSERNWHLMQLQFSPGILALMLTRDDYNIQNYEWVFLLTVLVDS